MTVSRVRAGSEEEDLRLGVGVKTLSGVTPRRPRARPDLSSWRWAALSVLGGRLRGVAFDLLVEALVPDTRDFFLAGDWEGLLLVRDRFAAPSRATLLSFAVPVFGVSG